MPPALELPQKARPIEPTPNPDVQNSASVTITGCLERDQEVFWLKDTSGEAARKMARECNDYAAKLIADYPGRFGMFTMLPLPDIDGSLKEIEYGFETLKADGVYMFTNWGGKSLYGDKYLGDPALAPIYEELQRRRAIVYTHPKDPACCHDSLPGVNGATIEYPMDTTRTILSLLSSGTAAKFPDVRFIFSHAGGATIGVVGRISGPPDRTVPPS
jgi:predicted TIM-barrel fold metal-dependent hydrolase